MLEVGREDLAWDSRIEDRESRIEDQGGSSIDRGCSTRCRISHGSYSLDHFPFPFPPLPPRFDCKTRTIFARDRSIGILRYRREDEWSEYGPFEAGSTALDSPPPCRLRDRDPTNRSPRLYFRIIRTASVASSQIRLCEKRRREAFC